MSLKDKNYHEEHKDGFVRLYWKSDKERINQILNHLPDKYLENLIGIFHNINNGYEHHDGDTDRNMDGHHSIMVRYDGCEFYASLNNLKQHQNFKIELRGRLRRRFNPKELRKIKIAKTDTLTEIREISDLLFDEFEWMKDIWNDETRLVTHIMTHYHIRSKKHIKRAIEMVNKRLNKK